MVLGDRLNSSGGCKAVLMPRARLGWVNTENVGELVCGRRFLMKMKGRIYWSFCKIDNTVWK